MPASDPKLERLARIALVVALLIFAGLGFWQSQTFMVWSEEMMVHSMPAAEELAPQPVIPHLEPSCLGPGAPWIVHSASRPTLSLCAGGRRWPIMIAPYFSGYFYWPFALLAPLHHDDAFVLRALGMVFGLLSLLVTFAVVRRLAGPAAAGVTALATAVMPCFFLVHATLEHFEGLPWIFMMSALLSFLRCGGRTVLPTRPLVLGALFIGLALAANLKSAVLVVAFIALALRLRVDLRRIEKRQWALMALASAGPLVPMIALAFAPANGYSDKSDDALRNLVSHLLEPRWALSSARGLVLLWADVGYYFADFADAPRPHVAAIAIAVAAACFVLVETVRTLLRRTGCPVVAACGVALLCFAAMVALLYDHFPSNFAPLHTVYGAAVALAALRLARAIGQRAASSAVVIAVALLPFGWSSADTIRSMADVHLHTNADAERALVTYLRAHSDEHVPVFTADLMLAGVVDSLSHGDVRTLRAHEFFSVCHPTRRNRAAPACVTTRWRSLLPFVSARAARYVAPTDWSRFGSEHIGYVPGLEQAARELGYRVTLERRFATRRGLPVLSLYRIDAP